MNMTKTSRRSLFAVITAVPFFGKMMRAKTTTESDLYKTSDASVWAKEFVATVKSNPSIATDEATMLAWFSSAIMRGYDERASYHDRQVREAGHSWLEGLQLQAIRGAVSRGWCADANAHKEMDVHLAIAIEDQLMKL